MSRKRTANGRFATSGGSLTGGTGDVKPQWLTQTTPLASGVDDYTIAEINVPRVVFSSPGRSTVMEILRVDWYLGILGHSDLDRVMLGTLTTRLSRANSETVTLLTLSADLADPSNFAQAVQNNGLLTSGSISTVQPISISMNDGNGNGMLIATDRIFMMCGEFDNTGSSPHTVKILYRMTEVSIEEYVGIVASQSTG